MSNLLRRLQKLESRLTDATGLMPRSEAWLNYWKRKLEGYVSEKGGIPMEAIDAISGT